MSDLVFVSNEPRRATMRIAMCAATVLLVGRVVKHALVLSPAALVRRAVIPFVSAETMKLVAFKRSPVAGVRGKHHLACERRKTARGLLRVRLMSEAVSYLLCHCYVFRQE